MVVVVVVVVVAEAQEVNAMLLAVVQVEHFFIAA